MVFRLRLTQIVIVPYGGAVTCGSDIVYLFLTALSCHMTMAESRICGKRMVIIVKLVSIMHINTVVYITIVT